MKNKNQRVLALDYFRGACMLAMVINHFSLYINPLTFLAGAGRLWTSAAEMFFLLSGITFGVVRGKAAATDFKMVVSKSWKRALDLYLINFMVVLASLSIAFTLTAHGRLYNIPGGLPDGGFAHTLLGTLSLSYGFGWASFLMYYGIFMLVAPFALKILYGRFWPVVPGVSAVLYISTAWHPLATSPYLYFLVWQLYFFTGIALGRFRLNILSRYANLSPPTGRTIRYGVVAIAGATTALGAIMSFRTPLFIHRLPGFGWLGSHQVQFDNLLHHDRTGLLRPIVTLMVFGAAYMLYQKNQAFLLRWTSGLVNTLGRNTLPVFIAQAVAIPLISAFLPHSVVLFNLLATIGLVALMWSLAQWANLFNIFKASIYSLGMALLDKAYVIAGSVRALRQKLLVSTEADY